MERLSIEEIKEILNRDWSEMKAGYFCINDFRAIEQSMELLDELKAYRDAEEQGLLLRLPCKVGSTVYVIDTYCIANGIDDEECESNELCETCRHYKKYVVCEKVMNNTFEIMIMMQDYCGRFRFGKTAFLTREEAEAKLAEMQKGER